MPDNDKKCAGCGAAIDLVELENEREEMLEELNNNYPGFASEDCEVVCESCYQEIRNMVN